MHQDVVGINVLRGSDYLLLGAVHKNTADNELLVRRKLKREQDRYEEEFPAELELMFDYDHNDHHVAMEQKEIMAVPTDFPYEIREGYNRLYMNVHCDTEEHRWYQDGWFKSFAQAEEQFGNKDWRFCIEITDNGADEVSAKIVADSYKMED